MSEYENRIFKTLTASEDKFKSAFEIANHLNMVKKKLIVQFWKNVEKELNALVIEKDSDFKVQLDLDIFNTNSKCSLYLDNNTKARFVYERLSADNWMGLWFKNPEFDIVKIDSYRTQQRDTITNCSAYGWWVSFQNTKENFNDFDRLLMILPDKSEQYAKAKALNLFELAVENKVHLEYIINNCLK